MSTKTYERVVDLLNAEIPAKISRNEFSRVTGINRNSIDRYKAGLGTPIFETLEKLGAYFGVSVAFLRGEENITESRAALGSLLLDFLNKDIVKTEDEVFQTVLSAYAEDNPNISEEVLKERTGRFIENTMTALFQALKKLNDIEGIERPDELAKELLNIRMRRKLK